MSATGRFIEELNADTYPFEQMFLEAAAGNSGNGTTHATNKPDDPTEQVRRKRHLTVAHVETPIEKQARKWQPQKPPETGKGKKSKPHPDPQHMTATDRQDRPTKTELCEVRNLELGVRQPMGDDMASTQPTTPASAPVQSERTGSESQNGVAGQNSVFGSKSATGGTDGQREEHITLTEREAELLRKWAGESYVHPSLFQMLVQIAMERLRTGTTQPVSTETLLGKTELDHQTIRTELFRHLKRAWDLGLLTRAGEAGKNNGAGSVWTLTADGKRFLVTGLRARLNTRKLTKLTDYQICQSMAEDEIGDWLIELRERNRILGAGARLIQPANQCVKPDKRRKRLALADDTQLLGCKAVSREEVAEAIQRHAINQAQRRDPCIGTSWAGLVK